MCLSACAPCAGTCFRRIWGGLGCADHPGQLDGDAYNPEEHLQSYPFGRSRLSRLGQSRLGQSRLGQSRLGQSRLGRSQLGRFCLMPHRDVCIEVVLQERSDADRDYQEVHPVEFVVEVAATIRNCKTQHTRSKHATCNETHLVIRDRNASRARSCFSRMHEGRKHDANTTQTRPCSVAGAVRHRAANGRTP